MRFRSSRHDLYRARKSVRFHTTRVQESEGRPGVSRKYLDSANVHMFIEDVSLGVMPIGGRRRKGPFEVAIEPSDPRVEGLLESALGRGDYTRGLADAVCGFVRECAKAILSFEEAFYEIVYLSNEESGPAVGFELEFVQPHTVVRKRRTFFQAIPIDVARERGIPDRIELPPDRLVAFCLPGCVQGRLKPMLESLGMLSLPPPMELMFEDMTRGTPRASYDFTMHEHSRKRAIARITKSVGWDARSDLGEEALEFYLLYRWLTFKRFKIELRDGILDTLNAALKKAGKQLGFSAQLRIQGLPTLADVDAARVQLENGAQPFGKIVEPFLL